MYARLIQTMFLLFIFSCKYTIFYFKYTDINDEPSMEKVEIKIMGIVYFQ